MTSSGSASACARSTSRWEITSTEERLSSEPWSRSAAAVRPGSHCSRVTPSAACGGTGPASLEGVSGSAPRVASSPSESPASRCASPASPSASKSESSETRGTNGFSHEVHGITALLVDLGEFCPRLQGWVVHHLRGVHHPVHLQARAYTGTHTFSVCNTGSAQSEQCGGCTTTYHASKVTQNNAIVVEATKEMKADLSNRTTACSCAPVTLANKPSFMRDKGTATNAAENTNFFCRRRNQV